MSVAAMTVAVAHGYPQVCRWRRLGETTLLECRRGERGAGVGERQPLYHLSLVSSLAVAQGERERKRERERICPEHISTDLHFICRFPPTLRFFSISYCSCTKSSMIVM